MDTIKTGKFISDMRKKKGLTQKQLADKLFISDKAVSKWETGRGLPEISIMIPLCNELEISINELLSGESFQSDCYKPRAEENLIRLIEENQKNKKEMTVSVICGIITTIAVCALVSIASLVEMPITAKIIILFLAVISAIGGITAAVMSDLQAGYFECPFCKKLFVPTASEYVKGYHTLTKRRLKCPHCKKTGMCKKRITR